jgi:two-component system, chemotaxis family, CheB/CheR fusion protein
VDRRGEFGFFFSPGPIKESLMKKRQGATAKPAGTLKSAKASREVRSSDSAFPVVGIGASAGGLEAFELFFKNMPPDSGMAFVLIPHLDPAHGSMMPELLKRFTPIRVVEAKDGVVVQPDEAYIIPPNKDMAIYHRTLQLTQPQKAHGLRMPIDFFFRSLAEDLGDKAVCIILSGTGTDGTVGLRAVHGAGGLTMVQEIGTAKYDGMPKSALGTGQADFVLPVDKMPEQLLAYAKRIIGKRAIPVSPAEKEPPALQKVLLILRSLTGHDFSSYKKTTIHRRVERRMDLHNIEDMTTYARYLQENTDEVQALFKELLIGVTSFFRDPEAFETLKRKHLPQALEDKPDGYGLRVWVPGCATGEEVYSLAIIVMEYVEKSPRDIKLQVFGTDIDEEAIGIARAGFYLDNIAADVSQDRIRRYFAKEEGGFRIKKTVRESVVFAVQNVIKDPPFTKLDLISCRNLLIYLETDLQDRLLPLFHFSLKPGGLLFLGTSESIGKFSDLYTTLDRKWKIFQTKGAAASQAAVFANTWDYDRVDKEGEAEVRKLRKPSLGELTQKFLLQTFAPPVRRDQREGGYPVYLRPDGEIPGARPGPAQPEYPGDGPGRTANRGPLGPSRRSRKKKGDAVQRAQDQGRRPGTRSQPIGEAPDRAGPGGVLSRRLRRRLAYSHGRG